jgi:catechol 2,3-dioxygenase-like lactoylglutathione lyase family enzyme
VVKNKELIMSENEVVNPPQMMIIIYVSDQQKSRAFYQAVLENEPVLDVPGMTEFELPGGLLLGIMPEDGITRILGDAVPHPGTGNGIPRCELYLPVHDPDGAYKKLIQKGEATVPGELFHSWIFCPGRGFSFFRRRRIKLVRRTQIPLIINN